MEKFWNMLYYFLYKFDLKCRMLFMKVSLSLYIARKTKFGKKYFEKKGYNSVDMFLENFKKPDFGLSYYFAGIYLNFAFMPLGMPLTLFCMRWYIKTFGKPDTPLLGILFMVGWGLTIVMISILYLLRKDKYLKYFRLFDKQSHKWKIKWAWISAGILLTPLVITILAMW